MRLLAALAAATAVFAGGFIAGRLTSGDDGRDQSSPTTTLNSGLVTLSGGSVLEELDE
jgi:hypothetical protein